VLGDGRTRHRERPRQLSDRGVPFREPTQDGPPRRVGQGAEGAIEAPGSGNHMVTTMAYPARAVKPCSSSVRHTRVEQIHRKQEDGLEHGVEHLPGDEDSDPAEVRVAPEQFLVAGNHAIG
jgi:hypothetical protein